MLTAKGLQVSTCHGAPVSLTDEVYVLDDGRKVRHFICDCCGERCKARIEPEWPAQIFKSPDEGITKKETI